MKETGMVRPVNVCIQILQHRDNDIFMEIKHCIHNMTKEDNALLLARRNNLSELCFLSKCVWLKNYHKFM